MVANVRRQHLREFRRHLERLSDEKLSHIRLPRLIMLRNFWVELYMPSKYGYSANNLAPTKDLFDGKEE